MSKQPRIEPAPDEGPQKQKLLHLLRLMEHPNSPLTGEVELTDLREGLVRGKLLEYELGGVVIGGPHGRQKLLFRDIFEVRPRLKGHDLFEGGPRSRGSATERDQDGALSETAVEEVVTGLLTSMAGSYTWVTGDLTITTRAGQEIEGRLVGMDADAAIIEPAHGERRQRIRFAEISNIAYAMQSPGPE